MAANIESGDEYGTSEAQGKLRREVYVDYDTRLAPTCMIWVMVGGLLFFIVTILAWIAGHIGDIDWGRLF